MQTSPRIAFIGGGNMARSLIGGMTRRGFNTGQMAVSDPNPAQRAALAADPGVPVTDDNRTAVADAGVVVFAVKPQILRDAAQSVSAALAAIKPLVISIAAGIAEPDLRRWLGYDAAIVRVMPNTPALIGEGASVLYANPHVGAEQRTLAERMLQSVGLALWVSEERHMDAVTALSGSGPAYFFLMLEVLEAAGRELGLSPELVHALATQTGYGATRMARESSEAPAELRKRVTSPGGTTEAALKVLQDAQLPDIFLRALTAARDRGAELSRQLGGAAA